MKSNSNCVTFSTLQKYIKFHEIFNSVLNSILKVHDILNSVQQKTIPSKNVINIRNDFVDGSKILLDTDLKIILLKP